MALSEVEELVEIEENGTKVELFESATSHEIDEKEVAEDVFNLVGVAVEQGQRVDDDDIEEDLEPVEYEDLEEWPEHYGDWEEEE